MLALYYLLALFSPEKKVFLSLSILFIAMVYMLFRRWNYALTLGFLAISPFNVGQAYKYTLLSEEQLFFNPQYPGGRIVFFMVSPVFIVGLLVLVKAVQQVVFGKLRIVPIIEYGLFFLVVCFMLFSSARSEYYPSLSLLTSLRAAMILAWTFLAVSEVRKSRRLLGAYYITIIVSVIFHAFIVLLQWARGGGIGTIIEHRASGVSPEIAVDFFRPFGLESHPNLMANTMLFGFFMSLAYVLSQRGPKRALAAVAVLGALISIIVSQSRAGYASLAFGLLPVLFFFSRNMRVRAFLQKRISPIVAIGSITLMALAAVFVVGRVMNTILFSLGEGGGFSVRKQLVQEARNIIEEKPFFGIGASMFIPAAYERNVTGVMYWFPEAVHNGFLLVASESGVLAAIGAVLLYYVMIRRTLFFVKEIGIKSGIMGFVFSQILFMFFHPVNNFITIPTGFMLILLSVFS